MSKNKKIILCITTIIIFLAIVFYNGSYVNIYKTRIRQETLKSQKISSDLDGVLIAYFTDLKYNDVLNGEQLKKIQNDINAYKPDVILFGGDVIDKQEINMLNQDQKDELTDFFEGLKANYLKYAVIGDEDKYFIDDILNIYQNSNFKVLDNSNDRLFINNSYLNVVGISTDYDIEKAYEGVNSSYYSIILGHSGDIADKVDSERSDYFLAGNSLGGKVYIPLINLLYRDEGSQNYYHGKYRNNNLIIDVSDGLGTNGLRFRLFTDSEVVFYKLKNVTQ